MRTAWTAVLFVPLATIPLRAQDPTPDSGPGLSARFRQLDKNGDGKLTREELPAGKIFDSTDADQDGLLTLEEIAANFRKQQSGTPATPPKPGPQSAPDPAAAPVAKVAIVETLNVPYARVEGVDPNLLSLDVHAPKGAKGSPVVTYVHGGYTCRPVLTGSDVAYSHVPGG